MKITSRDVSRFKAWLNQRVNDPQHSGHFMLHDCPLFLETAGEDEFGEPRWKWCFDTRYCDYEAKDVRKLFRKVADSYRIAMHRQLDQFYAVPA